MHRFFFSVSSKASVFEGVGAMSWGRGSGAVRLHPLGPALSTSRSRRTPYLCGQGQEHKSHKVVVHFFFVFVFLVVPHHRRFSSLTGDVVHALILI